MLNSLVDWPYVWPLLITYLWLPVSKFVWVILFFYVLDFFGVSVFSVIICFMTIWAVRLMRTLGDWKRRVCYRHCVSVWLTCIYSRHLQLEASHGRIMCAYHVVSLVCMPVCMDRSNSVVPVLAGGSVFIFPLHIGLLFPGVLAVLTWILVFTFSVCMPYVLSHVILMRILLQEPGNEVLQRLV